MVFPEKPAPSNMEEALMQIETLKKALAEAQAFIKANDAYILARNKTAGLKDVADEARKAVQNFGTETSLL